MMMVAAAVGDCQGRWAAAMVAAMVEEKEVVARAVVTRVEATVQTRAMARGVAAREDTSASRT